MSGSGISRATCKSAPRSRQISTPAATIQFFTGWMPFLLPHQQRQSAEGSMCVCVCLPVMTWKHANMSILAMLHSKSGPIDALRRCSFCWGLQSAVCMHACYGVLVVFILLILLCLEAVAATVYYFSPGHRCVWCLFLHRYRYFPDRRGGVSGFGVPPSSTRRQAPDDHGGRHAWGRGHQLGDNWTSNHLQYTTQLWLATAVSTGTNHICETCGKFWVAFKAGKWNSVQDDIARTKKWGVAAGKGSELLQRWMGKKMTAFNKETTTLLCFNGHFPAGSTDVKAFFAIIFIFKINAIR